MKRYLEIRIIVVISLVLASFTASANDNMTTFLKSCAFGTVGGALIGLASLATSENPNGKMSNVARGASLGLYAGIGYGLYIINNPSSSKDFDAGVWISPQLYANKVEGASLNWLAVKF